MPHIASLLDIAKPAEVIDATLGCPEVERRFAARADLTCLVVRDEAGGVHLLTRRRFTLEMAGPLAFGRALHHHRPVAALLDGGRSLIVPAATRLVDAARAALDRPRGRRYDDLIVTGAGGKLATVVVADLFAAVAELHEHRALHDPLTGLRNRGGFGDAVDDALAWRRERPVAQSAVLFIDVDDFKAINDSLGHAVGDELLTTLATRLRRAFREEDVVGRLGGDEFAVLLLDADREMALAAAERVHLVIGHPLVAGGTTFRVAASVGVAVQDDEDVDALLRNADLAMYEAKRAGKGRTAVYRSALHDEAVSRLELSHDLEHALERGELRVVYQPVVALEGEAVVGVEALVRWRHPRRGDVPPLEFIPLAERSGAIVRLGAWVLEEACAQVARWNAERAEPLQLGVNVAVRQLEAPAFAAEALATIERAGLPCDTVTLEITESDLTNEPATVLEALSALREAGVRTAIDDFGTGYSSFARLDRLPVGMLKIDRSFVARLAAGGSDGVLRGLLGLADAMGLRALAEGVETAEQAEVLRGLGCRLAQGYHFGRPLEVADVAVRLGLRPATATAAR